jgi:hypothetical protein
MKYLPFIAGVAFFVGFWLMMDWFGWFVAHLDWCQ